MSPTLMLIVAMSATAWPVILIALAIVPMAWFAFRDWRRSQIECRCHDMLDHAHERPPAHQH